MSDKEPIYPSNEAPPPYSDNASSGVPHPDGPQAPYQQQYPPQQYPPQQYPPQQYPPQQYPPQQYPQSQYPPPMPYPNQPPPGFAASYGTPGPRPVLLRALPESVTCQYCHQAVVTQLGYESGILTWLLCGAICLMGGIFGCCLIPFCINGCKDVVHRCPNCAKILGRFQRI